MEKLLYNLRLLQLTGSNLTTTDRQFALQFQANVAEGGIWVVFFQIRSILPSKEIHQKINS